MSNCPKCRGEMVEGFIPDFLDHNNSSLTIWIEGKPEKSFWTGTKIKDKKQFIIKTFRCVNCGFLEQYAIDEK